MVDIERYNSFLERLVRITHEEPYNRNSYLELITEMCKEYRLAKGVTRFYQTPMMETRGLGDSFCDFDNGKAEKILLNIRIETQTKAIIVGTVYGEAEEEERTEE